MIMSKDIRSFFKVAQTKKSETSASSSFSKPKRKANSLNSSDDEKDSVKPKDVKKKRRIIDSDEEEEKEQNKKDYTKDKKSSPVKNKKLVEVDVFSMFGKDPVKRKERQKITPKPNVSSSEVIDVDDEATYLEVSLIAENIEKQETSSKNIPEKSNNKVSTKRSPKKETKSEVTSPKRVTSPQKNDISFKSSAPPSPKKTKVIQSSSSKKKSKVNKETTVEEDEMRQERKQASIALYQQYKNRPTVLNRGCKEIPKGKPDCLKGMQFVISGIMESMERDEAADLIKSCGGSVVSGLSKKVTHLLLGEEAGPAKLAKAEEMGITKITEDELLSLIRKRSGLLETDSSLKMEVVDVKIDSPGKENRVKINEKSPKKENVKTATSAQPKPDTKPQFQTPFSVAESENMEGFSFVDKYKPSSLKQIIGQQGPSGNAQKLMNWLAKWHINNEGKKNHVKPNPWAKNNDGAAYKAALLSGTPGIGKTTTAHLVCKELMYDIVEFNASDTRSKRLLKEEVSSLLSNNSLAGYLTGADKKVSQRHVLIMDEVDGMAGNEDRGGVAELIALIKETRIPIICMCNDRNHPKIRSLANYCFDLRFHKPSITQIRGAMMSVCFKEGIKLEAGAIDEIIAGTNNDIRQTLNHLALYSASKDKKLAVNDAKKNAQMCEKDVKISSFEAIRKVFSAEEHKKMTFQDKSDLFFNDYNMAPLFVQENYLHVKPNCKKSQVLERIAMTADSLSLGDLVEKKIRSSQAWSLLPIQAIFSSVLPGEYMKGSLSSASNFPGWLGKTSRANKRKRLAQEVQDHTRTVTSGSRLSVRLDYAPFLIQKILAPLVDKELEGVEEALDVIKEYRLLREDIDALLELTTWPKASNAWNSIDGKVKAALTRAYNKEVQPYSYSAQAAVKKKSSKSFESQDLEEYENEEDAANSEEEENDSLENNALIKVSVKSKKSDKEPKAGTSKAKSSSKSNIQKASKSKSKK